MWAVHRLAVWLAVGRQINLNQASSSPVTRLQLANGLLVLLKEVHTAPLISQWLWYRVGSRDESRGLTGVSHWAEHMQFKGTPQFPAGELDRVVSRTGGGWNAFTSQDWTTYYEVMPSSQIDLALRLEADRMLSSLFKPEDVDSERTVIISERQGSENDPTFLLSEAVQGAAFTVHSYRHDTIGDLVDLQRIQRDDLYRHYRTYYVPNNAVLTLAGDFETESMLRRVRELYEGLPAGPTPPRPAQPEPPQTEERRLELSGPGETTYIEVAYRAPQADHPDLFPCLVLDSLLSGASNLSGLGGSLTHKTSLLYRSLVDGELAVQVSGGFSATLDPYLYSINLTLHPERKPEQALASLGQEIDRLQQSPPSAADVQRAVKQARALFAYGSETIGNQAYWLGFSEMYADVTWFNQYLERLAEVTPPEVQRVAQTYLTTQQRVVGIYTPNGEALPDPADEFALDEGAE